MTARSHGLGINCRGSSSCGGSSGTLSSLTAEICNQNPLSDTKPPGAPFAQAKCGTYTEAKAVFIQSTSQSLSYGQVCDYLRKLKSHGCKGCGSIPINPGNNVKNGQVTVNYVSQCTCTGGPNKCGVTKKRELGAHHELEPDCELAPTNELQPENDPAAETEVSIENQLAPELDQSPAPVLFKRLGINCRGSSSCPGIRVNNKKPG